MLIYHLERRLMPKGVIQVHRAAADNAKYILNLIPYQKIRDIVRYFSLHIPIPPLYLYIPIACSSRAVREPFAPAQAMRIFRAPAQIKSIGPVNRQKISPFIQYDSQRIPLAAFPLFEKKKR